MDGRQRVWCIRSGENYFNADELFTRHNYLGIGWLSAGDLLALEPNQQAIRSRLIETHRQYPDITPRRISLGAGDLYRFLYVAKIDDIVAYHSKDEGNIYVGKITSSYKYDVDMHQNAPHLRKVEWLSKKPRDEFSNQVRRKMGFRGPTFWEIGPLREILQLIAR